MTDLRRRMIRALKLRGFSPKTQAAYVSAIAKLSQYYGKSPAELSRDDLQEYLYYLLQERELSWNSCNVVLAAMRFFYSEVLGWDRLSLGIGPRKKPQRLPEIFSHQELDRLFSAAGKLRDRVLLMTAYSAGLRVGELVGLRIRDIHSDRMMIRVEQGKGKKDRYTLLSEQLLLHLRQYWRAYRPRHWLFPNPGERGSMSISTAQKIYNSTKVTARLEKGRGIHTLRHCFATHLLESGVDLHTIQTLMGHKTIQTTLIYLQVRERHLDLTTERLDLLAIKDYHLATV